jgi:hypothetical protein
MQFCFRLLRSDCVELCSAFRGHLVKLCCLAIDCLLFLPWVRRPSTRTRQSCIRRKFVRPAADDSSKTPHGEQELNHVEELNIGGDDGGSDRSLRRARHARSKRLDPTPRL